jgi:Uncharacterized membrane-anchored protein conserved in bacteria
MIRSNRLAAAVVLCLVFASTALAQDSAQDSQNVAQQIKALHWVEGPTQVSVGPNATFQVPSGYRFLGPPDTVKFMTLTRNLSTDDSETLFAPDNFAWWGVFDYRDVGHVSDNEKIDPNALLSSMRSNQVEANKQLAARGWATLEIVGWEESPFYDPDTHNLSWAMDAHSSSGGEVTNYNTRLLSRTGYTAATLVADPQTLQTSISQFKNVVSGYRFNDNQTYGAYKPSDKTAEYGLAALVTGGAAAVAVKTGFWKVILGALVAGWKLVVAFVVALFASIGKFIKRATGRDRGK